MDMLKMYKVSFNDNKPVSSEEVDFSNKVAVEFETSNGAKILKSVTIFAMDKDESIITANRIANYGKN